MNPELERRLLAIHLEELHRMAGQPRRRRTPDDAAAAAHKRPRVRAGLVLMRMGARLAGPAMRPGVWPAELPPRVSIGQG
jgi:hypothetical protein